MKAVNSSEPGKEKLAAAETKAQEVSTNSEPATNTSPPPPPPKKPVYSSELEIFFNYSIEVNQLFTVFSSFWQ